MNPKYSFSFGGVDLKGHGLYLTQRTMPALPRTRERTLDIPGRHGKLDFGVEFAERVISLPCVIRAQTDEEFVAKVRTLAGLFDPTKGVRRLVLDEEPDKFYMARYAGQLSINQVLQWGEFELPMACYDPFAYGTERIYEAVVETQPQELTVINAGTAPMAPVIIIKNESTTVLNGLRIQRRALAD